MTGLSDAEALAHVRQAIRLIEARLVKPVQQAVSSRELRTLNRLRDEETRLVARLTPLAN